MSPRYGRPPGDRRPADGQSAEEEGRPFTTGIGSMVGPKDEETASPPANQPTFIPRPDGP